MIVKSSLSITLVVVSGFLQGCFSQENQSKKRPSLMDVLNSIEESNVDQQLSDQDQQPSTELDLRKEIPSNSCLKYFPQSGPTPDNPYEYKVGICITSNNRVIHQSTHPAFERPLYRIDYGSVGKVENKSGELIQFEIEDGILTKYFCPAKDKYSRECSGEVSKRVWVNGLWK